MRDAPSKLAPLAGLVISLPALLVGLHDDDFLHRLALSGRLAAYQRDAWSLYAFLRSPAETRAVLDAGYLPWFADPELRVQFFRPLSSALLALDLRLFGSFALPAYLHTLLWFAVVLWLVARIHALILPARAALFSTLSYAVAGAHAGCTTWLAARHVLVSGAFALGAFYLSLSRRARPASAGPAPLVLELAPAGLLALGLCASEAALTVVPLFVAELWLGSQASLRERSWRSVPVALVTLTYLVGYGLLGFGTRHMGSYVNPLETPGRFALTVFERLPLLVAEALLGVPCFIGHFGAAAHRTLWVLGCGAAVALSSTWLWATRADATPRRVLAWLSLGFVGALLPVSGPILDGRVLLVPLVASSMLVGSLLARAFPGSGAAKPSLALRVVGGAFGLFALGLAPLVRVGMTLANRQISKVEGTMVDRAEIHCPAGQEVVVVNGSDPSVGLYSGPIFALREQVPWTGWRVLSLAPNDLQLEAHGPRTLVLQTLGERATTQVEALYRAAPLPAGASVRVRGMTATVEASSTAGHTRVRFDFDQPIAPGCLVRWEGGADGRLASFELPSARTLRLPHHPGPMGL